MAGTASPAQGPAAQDARQRRAAARGRGATVLFALTVTALAAIAVQFALAGFGAFTMDKTPGDNTYGAHVALGMVIAVLTLMMLVTVLADASARAHATTVRLAVALVVLALAVQPILGGTGVKVPPLGALHALNGLVIFALTGWLAGVTVRRRAAAQRPPQAA